MEALNVVSQAAMTNPDNPDLMFSHAILLALQSPHDARQVLKSIETRWPEWDRPYLAHGLLLERAKQPVEARQKLQIASALGTTDPILNVSRTFEWRSSKPCLRVRKRLARVANSELPLTCRIGTKSEIQLQAELENPHRLAQTANLANSRRIRNDRIVRRKAESVRLSKLRRVESIECFGAELQPRPLSERLERPVLAKREIEAMKSRRDQDIRRGVAVMAKLRMIRNIALRTPESSRIVPKLPGRLVEQTAIGDAIGIGARIRVQVSARQGEREAGTQGDDAAGLPSAQN